MYATRLQPINMIYMIYHQTISRGQDSVRKVSIFGSPLHCGRNELKDSHLQKVYDQAHLNAILQQS